jgi:hypothetical protein
LGRRLPRALRCSNRRLLSNFHPLQTQLWVVGVGEFLLCFAKGQPEQGSRLVRSLAFGRVGYTVSVQGGTRDRGGRRRIMLQPWGADSFLCQRDDVARCQLQSALWLPTVATGPMTIIDALAMLDDGKHGIVVQPADDYLRHASVLTGRMPPQKPRDREHTTRRVADETLLTTIIRQRIGRNPAINLCSTFGL